MDLSMLPTPVSQYNKQRTDTCFTVRSANSPSYSLNRRPGVRRPKGFSEGESTEEFREGEKCAANTGTNGTNKEEDHAASGCEARTGGLCSVKGQSEETETSGQKISLKLNQKTSTADKKLTDSGTESSGNPALESRGRSESRRIDLSTRSRSLDWRTREKSPDWGKFTDVFALSTNGTRNIRQTGVEGVTGRVMTSVQAYNSYPLSCMSQTLDRTSWGNSLPTRLRSQSGPVSSVRGAASSGQSILERIEKLYGSVGESRAEDSSKQRSWEKSSGGTFPRRFSSGERGSISPLQSTNSFTWTQKDMFGSETSLHPGTNRARGRLSGEIWQGQTQGKYFEDRGSNWGRGLQDVGTRSLDRARSRFTVAAKIRSARAAVGITTPAESNALLEEDKSVSLRDLSGLRERKASGSKVECRVNHGEDKCQTNTINGTLREKLQGLHIQEKEKEKETDHRVKEKTGFNSYSVNEDVFESNPPKITLKSIKKKALSTVDSVKNKINQFEALSQRAQGLATGQVLMPRRAFSVPTQLSKAHNGEKKSGSAKRLDILQDKWEGLKEGEKASDKKEEKVTGARKKLGSERSLSVDEVGLRLISKEKEGSSDSGDICAEDTDNYTRLKSTLEIPLNGGAQRQQKNFFIDETDFSKALSPDRPSFSPVSNFTDTSPAVQASTPPRVPSPVSDDKTPNIPNHSPFLSPITKLQDSTPFAESEKKNKIITEEVKMSSPLPPPAPTSSQSILPDLISSDISTFFPNGKKNVIDLDAWVAGLNPKVKAWNDDEDDYEDDDESTQKDEESNYDSDSGESSITVTSNMSQDRRSFCVSLSDLCNFAGVEYESENDSDEWQFSGRRTASLSSDMSAFSYVSVMPTEELDKLLEDVRNLGGSTLQDYDDVQVVVLHKEVGVGLGFSLAGGVDQNKPIIVHKVFHTGVAAREGSIKEGDKVLSINGTALSGYAHWEALRVLRRAKTRELGIVVLRKGGFSSITKENDKRLTQAQFTETDRHVCLRLEKNSRDLGFSLEGGVGSDEENRPLTVQKIFQGGPVDKVFPGDEVVEIEGVSMVGMRRLEAWTLIRRLPLGPVDVVLHRPQRQPET